ncbi:hypothetical protein [Pendulispora albinea]|uniref:Uncharacterized protein n=1 Tax=Pendulispora albinea TaxID=2741071 RepID=A0ABZ2M0C4_9BACT
MRRATIAILFLLGCSGAHDDSASSEDREPSRLARSLQNGARDTLQSDARDTLQSGARDTLQSGATSDEVANPTLTLQLIDRDGNPPTSSFVAVTDLNTARNVFERNVSGGTLEIPLPEGRYGVAVFITTPGPGGAKSGTYANLPSLAIHANTARTLDARLGKRVSVSLDEPSAKQKSATVFLAQPTARGNVQFPSFPSPLDSLDKDAIYAVPSEPAKGFAFYVQTVWTRGGQEESPYVYHLLSSTADRVPEQPAYRVRKFELARVRVNLAAQGVDWKDEIAYALSTPVLELTGLRVSMGDGARVTFPGTRTDYFTPGAWSFAVHQGASGVASTSVAEAVYARPGEYRQTWNTAPLGPSFPGASPYYAPVVREGDILNVSIPMYSEAEPGHINDPYVTVTGSMILRRGDEVIAQSDDVGSLFRKGSPVTVPPERATYELTSHGVRNVPWSLYATEQTVTWRFASEHTSARAALPLMAVRYAPKLDAYGRAPAGRRATFDIRVEHNAGASAKVATLRIFVSHDDGARWEPADVWRCADGWRASVRHPADADFVSLRAEAVDLDGNAVEQTLIRAHGLSH